MHEFLNNAGSIVRIQTWDTEVIPPPNVAQLLGAAWPRHTGALIDGPALGTAPAPETVSALGTFPAPRAVICLSPTEWLVLSDESSPASSFEELSTAFQGSAFRATDMSQALTTVRIQGETSCSVLAKGCALDLDPATFKVGTAVRTRLAGIPVVIWRTGNFAFECLLTRSYAEYFQAWLDDAALEFED